MRPLGCILLATLAVWGSGEDISVSPPRASLSTGVLEGQFITTKKGNFAKTFRGVPFAQPPLGELRFQPSVAPKPWTGVRTAKDWGDSCLYTVLPRPRAQGKFSEDCLYANVYAGLNCTVSNPCPVLIYVYGGANQFGSSSEWDPALLSDFYASHGIVFMTFNYRVGTWGFWNTGTDDAPGNGALWDIFRLLEWVQQEIGAFGGRADAVTLWGLSSASIDVSAVALSPRSKGLMKQVILQSGSSVVPAMFVDNEAAGIELAVMCNCTTRDGWAARDNFPNIVSCMQNVPSDALFQSQKKLDKMGLLYSVPRLDGKILTGQGMEMARTRYPIPMMVGSTAKEAALMVMPEFLKRNATANDLRWHCDKNIRSLQGTFNLPLLTDRCVALYSKKAASDGFFQAVVAIDSAVAFWAPSFSDAASARSAGAPVYLYSFEFQKSGMETITPFHAGDMEYNLRDSFLPQDKRDALMRDIYPNYFANFAKFGNPTPWDLDWAPLASAAASNYYSIDLPHSVNKVGYHVDDWEFWGVDVPELGRRVLNEDEKAAAAALGDEATIGASVAKAMLLQAQLGIGIPQPSTSFSAESVIGTIAGVMTVMVIVGSVVLVVRHRKQKRSPERSPLLA